MSEENELSIELLKQLKKGNEKAFRIIFNTYFPLLLSFSKEYVSDQEVAKNIVQETFLTLWEKRSEFNENTKLKGLLYTTVKNKALNHLKAQKVRLKYEERLKYRYNEYLLNYAALTQIDFDSVSFKELAEIVDKVVQKLPPQCKKVFELSRYESLKNREIASKLDISEKAVEAHITKALKQLRNNLGKYFPAAVIPVLLAII